MRGDESALRADPDLVAAWVRGWAMAREVSPPSPHTDGFRVEVGWPDQVRRFVFPALSDEIARLGQEVQTPFVYLKACAPAESLRRVLGRPWSVADPSYMMTLAILERPVSRAPQGYRLSIDASPMRAIVKISADDTADDTVVASGHVVVTGDLAVYDRIVTHPDHRRRGLGTLVMAELGQAAIDLGARRGALVATEAGRGVYESLGWRLHSPYASAVIPGKTAVQPL